MSDRTLLELAAKAYWGDEIDDVCSIEWSEDDDCIAYTHVDNQDHNGNDQTFLWNPRDDDGDALRLAVKLDIHLTFFRKHVDADAQINFGPTVGENFTTDKEAATRLAIVRAAAEIGRGKEPGNV